MASTIPLAQSKFTPAKLNYPVYLSYKYDGVPIRVVYSETDDGRGRPDVTYTSQSRQGKPILSVDYLLYELSRTLHRHGFVRDMGDITIVGEITHKTISDFKDVSGIVRRKEQQPDLILNIFEMHHAASSEYRNRLFTMDTLAECLAEDGVPGVNVINQFPCDNYDELVATRDRLLNLWPDAEGFVVRNHDAPYAENKRDWGYQKWIEHPTADLVLHSFEEAIDKYGQPKGMVGRINVLYKSEVIGCGPGKMSHEERRFQWETNGHLNQVRKNQIVQVKYKRDPSYDALREPTFQCWREDKEVSHE